MKTSLEFTLGYQSLRPGDFVRVLGHCAARIGLSDSDYAQAEEVLRIESGAGLDLSGRVLTSTSGCAIANHGHDGLFIEIGDLHIDRVETLVECLVPELDVLQAFVHDDAYHRWQNAESITLYEVHGVDHSALPKVNNGLPFPLAAEIVDISRNPGRSLLRDGYRESIASPMWIRRQLVEDLEAIRSMEGVQVTEFANLLKIRSPYRPFTSDAGDQRRLQEQMRRAIYGV